MKEGSQGREKQAEQQIGQGKRIGVAVRDDTRLNFWHINQKH